MALGSSIDRIASELARATRLQEQLLSQVCDGDLACSLRESAQHLYDLANGARESLQKLYMRAQAA